MGNGFGWGFGNGLGWGLGWGLGNWALGGLGLGGWGMGGLGLGGWGMGMGGMGLSCWGMGTPYYDWGFGSYANPYVVATTPVVLTEGALVDSQFVMPGTTVVDYAQPLDTQAPAPADDVTTRAEALFDQARGEFVQGQYGMALTTTDSAIALLPQDATLHEFRALCLFALGRYSDSAAVLYSVLAVGPGWDWPTLIGRYPGIETYTAQLRSLEAAVQAQPDEPAPHFLLAYHYLTQGHKDAAAAQYRQIVALRPDDKLSAQLLAMLDPNAAKPAANAGVAPPPAANVPGPLASMARAAADALKLNAPALVPPAEAAAAAAAAAKTFPITGRWKATNAAGTPVALTIDDQGQFSWAVEDKAGQHAIQGASTLGKTGVLTLASDTNDGVLVGKVTWTDADHFAFHLVGSNGGDADLKFERERP
jgi:tetratricopeptide (TPR) repeat protein